MTNFDEYRTNGGTYVIPCEILDEFIEEYKETSAMMIFQMDHIKNLEKILIKNKEELELVKSDLHNGYRWLEREEQENKQLKEQLNKIKDIVYCCSQNNYFFKYNGKYLKSEIIEQLQEILDEEK